MQKPTLATALMLLIGLTLTGCNEHLDPPSDIERGKECFEAGGNWSWSDWSGYTCEFMQ